MIKIAVPVEGENLKIFTRTGRAPYFAIFEFDKEKFNLISLNENTHSKEHAHDHHHEEHTDDEVKHHHRYLKTSKISDCNYIIVRALGPNMKDALDLAGIKPIKVSKKDGEYALEVLEKVKNKLETVKNFVSVR